MIGRAIIIVMIVIITGGFINGCSRILFGDTKSKGQEQKTEQQARIDKDKSDAIFLVDEVKKNCAAGDYVKANESMDKLSKNKYGDMYAEMLKQDYPELATKAETQKQEKAADRKRNFNAFNTAMSNSGIYAGSELSDGMLVVNISTQWFSVDNGTKRAFVQAAKDCAANYHLPYAFIVVRYPASNKIVARWNESDGISIEK